MEEVNVKKEKSNLFSSIIDALDSLRLKDFAPFIVRAIPFIVLRGIFLCSMWTMGIFLSTKMPLISVMAISALLGMCYSTLEDHLS